MRWTVFVNCEESSSLYWILVTAGLVVSRISKMGHTSADDPDVKVGHGHPNIFSLLELSSLLASGAYL